MNQDLLHSDGNPVKGLSSAGAELSRERARARYGPRHRLEQMGRRRTVALVLDVVIAVANAAALVALIASLLSTHEKHGGELLLKGATIWGTNVITFGLLFWEFDRGGPIRPGRRFRRRQTFSSPRTRTQRLPNRTGTRGWPTICVRLLHKLNCFQPDRRDAADPSGEDDDADGVRDLGNDRPVGGCASCEHPALAASSRSWPRSGDGTGRGRSSTRSRHVDIKGTKGFT